MYYLCFMQTLKDIIESNVDKWSNILKSFPRGDFGLTPDVIKATAEYKEAKQQYNYWFEQLRAYNKQFLKTHKCVGFEIVNGKRVAIYQPKKVK